MVDFAFGNYNEEKGGHNPFGEDDDDEDYNDPLGDDEDFKKN